MDIFSSLLSTISLVAQLAFVQTVDVPHSSPGNQYRKSSDETVITVGNTAVQEKRQVVYASFLPPDQLPYCTAGAYSECAILVTAYSSTVDQTDDTPFITASQTHVRDGVIAANFLPFGTKVRFPQMYGDKVFIVEDRLAPKNSHKIDIWFPSRDAALEFGKRTLAVEILG